MSPDFGKAYQIVFPLFLVVLGQPGGQPCPSFKCRRRRHHTDAEARERGAVPRLMVPAAGFASTPVTTRSNSPVEDLVILGSALNSTREKSDRMAPKIALD
eukprot:2084005-Pyramimonas_sp.AAC.1